MILDIAEAILDYESDTFSAKALNVRHQEAKAMAEKISRAVLDVVRCGGSFVCDGTRLAIWLEDVREHAPNYKVTDIETAHRLRGTTT